VREALYVWQREFALQEGGAVLDGRDIGTVIAPEAEAKLFVTASVEARAKRRYLEMVNSGREADIEAIAADLAARDERDRNRQEAPLRAADDALLLDNSDLSAQASIDRAIALVESRITPRR
jgi:cytidylate kinase